MQSWTDLVNPDNEDYHSEQFPIKLYLVDPPNPLNQTVFVRQYTAQTAAEAEKYAEGERKKQAIKHECIVPIVDIVQETREDSYFVYVILPSVGKKQRTTIEDREIANFSIYPEEELWPTFKRLLSACVYMQERDAFFWEITATNIFFDKEGKAYIADTCGFNCDVEKTNLRNVFFLSPSLRRTLILRDTGSEGNQYKSNVFSFGVSMLQATRLELPECITVLRELQEKLHTDIDTYTNYSAKWRDLLRLMTTVNEDGRPDFLALREYVEAPFSFADDDLLVKKKTRTQTLDHSIRCTSKFIRVDEEQQDEYSFFVSMKGRPYSPYTIDFSVDIVAVIEDTVLHQESKLRLVKRTLNELSFKLSSNSRISLFVVDQNANRVLSLVRCAYSNRYRITRAVRNFAVKEPQAIQVSLDKGLEAAIETIERRRFRNPNTSIIVFSTGETQYESGMEERCAEMCARARNSQTTLHTFVYESEGGSEFMERLAGNGGGVCTYLVSRDCVNFALQHAMPLLIQVAVRDLDAKITLHRCPISYELINPSGTLEVHHREVHMNEQKNMFFTLYPELLKLREPVTYEFLTFTLQYTDANGERKSFTHKINMTFRQWRSGQSTDYSVYHKLERAQARYFLQMGKGLAEEGKLPEAIKCFERGVDERGNFETFHLRAIVEELKEEKRKVQKIIENRAKGEKVAYV